MLEDLQRRNYARTTIKNYLSTVEEFAKHFDRPPDQLGLDEIRTYQAYLLKERKMGVRTVGLHTAGLRFFFCKTLRRNYPVEEFPYPKKPRELPCGEPPCGHPVSSPPASALGRSESVQGRADPVNDGNV